MAWTRYQTLLAITLVVTGSLNTLSTKWADNTKAVGKDGEVRGFKHPFVQACAMFLGEMLCLITFKALFYAYRRRGDRSEETNELVKGNQNFNPLILFIPAVCDMIATSTMYVGLNLTYASSFQMLRGSVIIFVALLSVGFLDRVLVKREWVGIGFVIVGLAVVGLADFITNNSDTAYSRNNIITGDLLIIAAQIITAVQMVYEERFVAGLDIPALQAVGYEGFFGFCTLGVLLLPMYYIKVGVPFNDNANGSLEDLPDALVQIANSWQLIAALLGTIVSIAFFNFAGISVTKEISATTRMVLDSVRTVVIWVFALMVGWQDFQWLQVVGFAALLFGMCLYNNVIVDQVYQACRTCYIRRRYGHLAGEVDVIVNRPADEPNIA